MTAQSALPFVLLGSLWLVVLSLGTRSTPADTLYLFRRPRLLLRAVLSIFVAVPVLAILLSMAFDLKPAIKFAMLALAVAPVPPILPLKQGKAGGEGDYAIGLLVAAAVVSLVATPALVGIASQIMGVDAGIPINVVARTLLMTVALPLCLGIGLRVVAPGVAAVVQPIANTIGLILLLGVVGVVVVTMWPMIAGLAGISSLLAMAAMVALGLLVGHTLGSYPEDASGSLALATATRHPGVALAIATASFPGHKAEATAAVLLFILVNAVVTTPYVLWMGKRTARAGIDQPASTTPEA